VRWPVQYRAGSRRPPTGRDTVRKELEREFTPAELVAEPHA
jgi:hypothetical protein